MFEFLVANSKIFTPDKISAQLAIYIMENFLTLANQNIKVKSLGDYLR